MRRNHPWDSYSHLGLGRQVRPHVRQAEEVCHAAVAGLAEGAVQVPLPPRESKPRPRPGVPRRPRRERSLDATTAPTMPPPGPEAAPWRTGWARIRQAATRRRRRATGRADGGKESAAPSPSTRRRTPARRSSAERPGTGTWATRRCPRPTGARLPDPPGGGPARTPSTPAGRADHRHHPEFGRAPAHQLEGGQQQRESRWIGRHQMALAGRRLQAKRRQHLERRARSGRPPSSGGGTRSDPASHNRVSVR